MMPWRDDLADDWDDARSEPPVADHPVDPLLLGVNVDELAVDLADRR